MSSADLQVVLSVQHPGGELLLGGAGHAPQTPEVKGQAHDGLRVGFDSAQRGPLGYVPQQQRTVLVSGQQERPVPRVGLRERRDSEMRREGTTVRCEARVLQSKKTTTTTKRRSGEAAVRRWKQRGAEVITLEAPVDTRKDAAGSIRQAAAAAAAALFPTLHYTTPHFAPHLYFRV